MDLLIFAYKCDGESIAHVPQVAPRALSAGMQIIAPAQLHHVRAHAFCRSAGFWGLCYTCTEDMLKIRVHVWGQVHARDGTCVCMHRVGIMRGVGHACIVYGFGFQHMMIKRLAITGI